MGSNINFSQMLYKYDTTGRIRVLHVFTEGDVLIQESGVLDGNLVKHEKVCKPKNVGKSNETTGAEQAVLEAKSKVAEKLTTGYFDSIEKLDDEGNDVVLPMLAHDYHKMTQTVDWEKPVYSQPKFDGQRCLIVVKEGNVTLLSRQGKVIDTMEHIKAEIESMVSSKTNLVLDGELYAHGLSFQDNMRLIKKYRQGESEKVLYNVYDLVENQPYHLRFENIVKILTGRKFNYIVLVKTTPVSYNTLKHIHAQNLSEGYEGTMIRHGNSGYEINSRSKSLLKYKDFMDIALPIINVIPSDARPTQGVIVCRLPNGQAVKANLKFSHAEREEILKNKADYIGKIAELRYFETTDDGSLRFPVCVGFRNDK